MINFYYIYNDFSQKKKKKKKLTYYVLFQEYIKCWESAKIMENCKVSASFLLVKLNLNQGNSPGRHYNKENTVSFPFILE